jgi:hypothetical protein
MLGFPGNFRQHILWKIIWTLGTVICALTLVMSYVLLTTRPPEVVYAWVGFQLFWVLCRSGFFHVADSTSKIVCPTHQGQRWENLGPGLKERVLELLLALSKYQAHIHPRSSYSYSQDVMDLGVVQDLLTRYTLVDEYPLDLHQLDAFGNHPSTTRRVDLIFRAVMGDTFISGDSWFNGFKHTPMDLYDCCVVFLEIPIISSEPLKSGAATKLCAIPAVRPMSSVETVLESSPVDVEAGPESPPCDQQEIRRTSPKGTMSSGITGYRVQMEDGSRHTRKT